MKLKFNSNLGYQLEAINSIVDVFDGQTIKGSNLNFEINNIKSDELKFSDLGIGNKLEVTDEVILKNIKEIQKRNEISKNIRVKELQGRNFSVEMETGTGKTYVYLRTIHELYQQYGFKKFIIVVPSIAIREGVLKNLEITEDHFESLYGNVPLDYFVYDSSRLGKLRSFATSNNLQIMVINIDSFRRDENIIKQVSDRMSGRRPLEFIQATNPIVVMDEPQNMETKKSKKAIKSLNPLCTLRYSATHRDYYNLVYRLTPVDAYDLNLVKKIEVDSVQGEEGFESYIKALSITPQKTQIKAKLEIRRNTKKGVKKEKIIVKSPSEDIYDLYEISNQREEYEGYVLDGIDAEKGFVRFTNGEEVYEGQDKTQIKEEIQKVQIRETIREHLEKERRLKDKNIKVLSLFFIDRVKNYRDYKAKDLKGKFAKWFEEIYKELINKEYKDLESEDPDKVHEGYFSKDRKGDFKDSKTGDAQYDVPTYDLIMKDKEKLLSFDTPIKFIFSHSALREGWDNPNVFQICTLNETKSKLKKRQEIGRGLRIPVNQDGDRVFDNSMNILTVIANESYENFARTLQKEIEEEAGVEFGKDRIKRKRSRRTLKLKKGWKTDKEFLNLWKRIQPKTMYRVQLDSKELIKESAREINKLPAISEPKIRIEKTRIEISQEKGVETRFKKSEKEKIKRQQIIIPDLLSYLSRGTNLTKETILKILKESGRLNDFLINPQKFLDMCLEKINKTLTKMMVDGIKYKKIGEGYAMSLFKSEELESYLDNMYKVEKKERSLFDYVIYDSDIEKSFVENLESMERVKFYIKLPSWFKIDTPLGSYNPDWGVVFNKDKRIYFVAESKGSIKEKDLRPTEEMKIECGKRHFDELDEVEFRVVTKPNNLI